MVGQMAVTNLANASNTASQPLAQTAKTLRIYLPVLVWTEEHSSRQLCPNSFV